MSGTFQGMRIVVSDLAVVSRKVRRIKFTDFEWRGKRDWTSRIVTATVSEPAAFVVCGQMIVHPVIYQQLMAEADANRETAPVRADPPDRPSLPMPITLRRRPLFLCGDVA